MVIMQRLVHSFCNVSLGKMSIAKRMSLRFMRILITDDGDTDVPCDGNDETMTIRKKKRDVDEYKSLYRRV